jgi:hypothetical protein
MKCKDNISYPKFLANLTEIELRMILLVCNLRVIWIYLRSTLFEIVVRSYLSFFQIV